MSSPSFGVDLFITSVENDEIVCGLRSISDRASESINFFYSRWHPNDKFREFSFLSAFRWLAIV